MHGLVWSNLPWDWNLMNEMLVEGVNDGSWVFENIHNDNQTNGGKQQTETFGMLL